MKLHDLPIGTEFNHAGLRLKRVAWTADVRGFIQTTLTRGDKASQWKPKAWQAVALLADATVDP